MSAASSKKKPRKKARPPQVISEQTWKAIEMAVVAGGLGYTECGRKFGVSPYAIMMKARRHGWAVPSKIAERAAALQARYVECENDRNGNAQVIEVVAQSWAQKGEAHRALAFDLAHNSLKEAAQRGLPIEDWRDADLADKVARRNSGLDRDTNRVTLGLQLIEYRLQDLSLSLPKDASDGDGLNEQSPVKRVDSTIAITG